MKKLNALINKIDTPVWLEVLFIIVFLVRIPTFFEPYWNASDLTILDLGIDLRLFWIKVLLTIWNMIILYFFWKLVVIFFPKEKRVQKSSSYIFAFLTALVVFQTNIAGSYFFITGTTIILLYFIFSKTGLGRTFKFKSFLITTILLLTSLIFVFIWKNSPLSFILILPWVSIFIGLLLSSEKLEQLLAIVPLALILAIIVFGKYEFTNPALYYSNFLEFTIHKQDKQTYFSHFGKNVNRNYEIADFVNSSFSKNESIYILGEENNLIYALSQRSTPNLNIQQNAPTLIIILPDYQESVDLLSLLTRQYMLISQIQGAQIWHIIRSK